MSPDIELKRLKEIDFLNLFDLKFEDFNWCFNGVRKICAYSVYDGDELYDYRTLRKWIKNIYDKLEDYLIFLNKKIKNKNEYPELYNRKVNRQDQKQKIEKYFLKIKLEKKLITINKEKVRKI